MIHFLLMSIFGIIFGIALIFKPNYFYKYIRWKANPKTFVDMYGEEKAIKYTKQIGLVLLIVSLLILSMLRNGFLFFY